MIFFRDIEQFIERVKLMVNNSYMFRDGQEGFKKEIIEYSERLKKNPLVRSIRSIVREKCLTL